MNEMRPVRSRSRRTRRWLWVLLTGLVASTGIWAWLHFDVASHFRSPEKPRVAEAPAQVHTALAVRKDLPVYLNGLGNVQAWNSVAVRSRVDGQVETLAFKEGQLVQAGDVLVEIDARPYRAALDQATAKVVQDEANLKSAQSDLARTTALVGNGYATKQLFDQQTGTVNQLTAAITADKAAVENAKVQLDYTTIKAPISGRVGLRTIDVGNIVHTSDMNPVVTITQTQPIAVIFTAPEDHLGSIVAGLKTGPVDITALTPDGNTELGEGKLWRDRKSVV